MAMETAVEPPASYPGRDPCLEQAGPSGCPKKIPKRPQFDNSANNDHNDDNNNNNNNNNNRSKRRGSFGNAHDKVKKRRRSDIVLPTRFMLGGNITDPLNLRSLENEEVNRLANQTPVASPAPVAGGGSERVEVIIPQNINDPLNLNGPEPEPELESPAAPLVKKRRKRNRNKKRKTQEEKSQDVETVRRNLDEASNDDPSASSKGNNDGGSCNNNNNSSSSKNNNNNSSSSGSSSNNNNNSSSNGNNNNNNNNSSNNSSSSNNQNNNNNNNHNSSSGKKNKQRFRFGNYTRYYGYRNGSESDSRLSLLKKKWFFDKSCLDIGCNVGHVTLSIARDHQPKQMIGLDIDPDLVRTAKHNMHNYVQRRDTSRRWFPASFPLTFGPIALSGARTGFPHNVFFIAGNYVLESDEMLESQKAEFDTIMCLSTTKWMQLNFGDEGLKRVFHRIFRQLKPGGRFILEPQPLSSYHKLVTPTHRENFRRMQLQPDMYPNFIINEVGFASYKMLGVAAHDAKGFQRPVYLFRKAKTDANQGGQQQQRQQQPEEHNEDEEDDVAAAAAAAPAKPLGPSPAHECDTTTASI